jgi:16S rRNA (guanine966-N2)-methyltransferase
VLDLFAGSGALGLEALSRGAGAVTLRGRRAGRDQRRSGQPRGAARSPKCAARRLRFLAPHRSGAQYDLVFLDPRTGCGALARRCRRPSPPCWRPGAVVVAESDRRAPLALDLPLNDERRYGDTLIRIYGP